MGNEQIKRPRGKNTRWSISALLCSVIILNYFDRVAISVAAPEVQKSFELSAFEIGLVFSIYTYSYTFMQLPIGGLLDRWGVGWITRISMVIWSVLSLLFAFVHGKLFLYALRLMTGAASASAFPAASKATANWFPNHERGLANALFDSSAKLSNVIGAPLVAIMITVFDWRTAIFAIGVLNVIFTIVFWRYYDEPERHKRISDEEINYLQAYGAGTTHPHPYDTKNMLKQLFLNRKVWGLTIGFTGYGYTFNLLLTWLPTFFKTEFELDLLQSGLYTAIPWLIAALVGIFVGGWLVDYLIGKGHEKTKVFRYVILFGMTIGLTFIGSIFTEDAVLSIVFISIGLAGISATAPVGWTISALIAPPGTTAIMSSIVNFANNLFGGIIAALLTGYIVDVTGSFDLAFIIAAVVLVIGLFFYIVVLGDIRQIELNENQEGKQT